MKVVTDSSILLKHRSSPGRGNASVLPDKAGSSEFLNNPPDMTDSHTPENQILYFEVFIWFLAKADQIGPLKHLH